MSAEIKETKSKIVTNTAENVSGSLRIVRSSHYGANLHGKGAILNQRNGAD